MPTGAPDWQGLRWKTETTIRPNLIHPTGKLFFVDLFDSAAMNWTKQEVAGATVIKQTTTSFAGDSAIRINIAGVAGSLGGISKYFGLPITKKIGLEARFTVPNIPDGILYFKLDYYDGTNVHGARFLWYDAGDKWTYIDKDGGIIDITDGSQDFFRSENCWQQIKMVADFDTGMYERLSVNDKTWDLSTVPVYTTASATKPSLEANIALYTVGGVVRTMYVDHVVLTEE